MTKLDPEAARLVQDLVRDELEHRADKHTQFLERQLRHAKIIFAVAGVCAVALGFSSMKSIESSARSVINGFLTEQSFADRITVKVNEGVNRVPSRVADAIQPAIDAALRDEIEDAISAARERAVARIDAVKGETQIIESALARLDLVGTITAWAGSDLPNTEVWRKCDGSLVSITGKDDPLFKALGGLYDRKDKETPAGRVRLPDLQGYFLRGAGHDDSFEIGKPQPGESMKHEHHLFAQLVDGREEPGDGSYAASRLVQGSYEVKGHTAGDVPGWDFVSEAVGGNEPRPMNYSVHWIIRVK